MIKNNLVYEKAYPFAIRIANAYKKCLGEKQELVLSNQLLRRGTSAGTNTAEANGALSDADFSARMSTAYKEIVQPKYWLSPLKDTGFTLSIHTEMYLTMPTKLQKYCFRF